LWDADDDDEEEEDDDEAELARRLNDLRQSRLVSLVPGVGQGAENEDEDEVPDLDDVPYVRYPRLRRAADVVEVEFIGESDEDALPRRRGAGHMRRVLDEEEDEDEVEEVVEDPNLGRMARALGRGSRMRRPLLSDSDDDEPIRPTIRGGRPLSRGSRMRRVASDSDDDENIIAEDGPVRRMSGRRPRVYVVSDSE